jgi:hypothetical protein
MCALELFALGLGVGVINIVCLSNHKNVARDVYFICLVLLKPVAFRRLRLL